MLDPLLGTSACATLDIAEGASASLELTRLLFHGYAMSAQERSIVREQLLEYCRADTWEMVRLLAAVRMLAAPAIT